MQSLLEAESALNRTSPDSSLGPLIDYKCNNTFGFSICLHYTSPFQVLVQKVTVYEFRSYQRKPYCTASLFCCRENGPAFLMTWGFLFRGLSHWQISLHSFFGLLCWVGSYSGRRTLPLKSLCKIPDIVENSFQKMIVILVFFFFFFKYMFHINLTWLLEGLAIWSCYQSV